MTLWLIRFIYYIYNYRLLYYLPMERMGKEVFREEIPRPYSSFINELEEENKKLNIKVVSLEWEIKWLNSVIEKLHKEIEEQEAEWGWLFDEIDYRKREAKRLWWKPNN